MKMELQIGGKVVIIEAEGAVSVRVFEESEAARPESGQAQAPVAVPENEQEQVPQAVSESVREQVPEEAHGGDDGLFARLSELRRGLAAAENIPPYMVFKDTTLREMAEKRPVDPEGLSAIKGVGAAKLDKYGGLFLEEIKGVAA